MKQKAKYKLIYNPNAGKKRIIKTPGTSLEDIKGLFEQYQIEIEYCPTKGPKHATTLAKEAIEQGFSTVIAAGGDGTVSEVANGLVNSDVTFGILPLGTFMNIARMLSIPDDLEKAVEVIKIGRTRKIDVGSVTRINGEKLDDPYYFLETAGIGLDAELQETFKEVENGNLINIIKLIKIYMTFYSRPLNLEIDGESKHIKSQLITISNGPYTGAALPIAPDSKLNDHKLTLSFYKMSKWELINHFINVKRDFYTKSKHIKVIQADSVRILNEGRHIHADASLFGYSPVSFKIIPSALTVICGFPKPEDPVSLNKKTALDP